MALQGEIIPLPTEKVVWNGINTEVIEKVSIKSLKEITNVKLYL